MIENLKEFLISMGLGRNEAEIYMALLKKGNSSVLDLSKITKLHRSNIYDDLRSLMGRGLVYEIGGATRLFSPKPLNKLMDYLRHKEIELGEIVKKYESLGLIKNNETKIKISKGHFAMRDAIFSMLETGQPFLVYGIPKDAPEIIGPILRDFHKARIKRKILMKQIYNSGAVERAKYLNKMPFTEARILPSKYDSFATTNISGNKIFITLWGDDLTVLEVINESMAKPYKNYFDILWKKAKVV